MNFEFFLGGDFVLSCFFHLLFFVFLFDGAQARASEGCSFLNECRDKWEDKAGPLQQHMAWHLGLFSLERGQETRAQRVFDTLLAPPRVSKKKKTKNKKRRLPQVVTGKYEKKYKTQQQQQQQQPRIRLLALWLDKLVESRSYIFFGFSCRGKSTTE